MRAIAILRINWQSSLIKSLFIHLFFILVLAMIPEFKKHFAPQEAAYRFPEVLMVDSDEPVWTRPPTLKAAQMPVAKAGLGELLSAVRMSNPGQAPSQRPTANSSQPLARLAQAALKNFKNSNDATRALQAQGIEGRADKGVDLGNTQFLQMPKSKLAQDDLPEVLKRLSQKSQAYRTCYEQALLIDPSLKGKIDFLFSLANGGTVDRVQVAFAGQGTTSAQSRLRGCFETISKQIRFPNSFSGEQLKTRLLLRS